MDEIVQITFTVPSQ